MTTKTYTRKVGLNRGKPRIWLEGLILSVNGFHHGDTWEASRDGRKLILKASKGGSRRIAGALDRPIIDINSASLLEGFVAGSVVSVEVIRKGHIVITQGEG